MIHIIFKSFTVFTFLNIIRFRDVMVSIPDFESGHPGSNPGETYLSVWRNWIAHQTSNLGVTGSSPVMDIYKT